MIDNATVGSKRSVVVDLLSSMPATTVHRAMESMFTRQLGRLWNNHWLPAEAIRQVRRSTSATGAELMGVAVAADHSARPFATTHPRWRQHIHDLALPPTKPTGWVAAFARSRRLSIEALVTMVADVLRAGGTGIELDELIPPPGSAAARQASADNPGDNSSSNGSIIAERQPSNNPVLEKVRNLLAQAESTNFDAEAEAFTAKAQELMARHSLDEALVWARNDMADTPVVARIALDDPYAEAKGFLLQSVADNMGCRSIRYTGLGMSSVVGFEADLASVEALYTSLLIQAQQSLQRSAATAPPGARTRSRGYRSSFLVAYAIRIGDRLAEINAHVRQEAATTSDDLLPVLASRSDAVDREVDQRYGENLRSSRIGGGSDLAGMAAGYQAADQAELAKSVSER